MDWGVLLAGMAVTRFGGVSGAINSAIQPSQPTQPIRSADQISRSDQPIRSGLIR
ncbi:hypothetical protein JX580_02310 [Thiomicrospira microaerophila]|uniref:hypothetical protein n=1 Tax=Thiomicrospira microaerophila TaxID=406020 RepID=UPI00200EA257|nr:hypothetical protein [Thiomicrospira microaerophila]UQB42751.1 hypothetical protein JX580_02310 [Thiomicrospira microaerophila]